MYHRYQYCIDLRSRFKKEAVCAWYLNKILCFIPIPPISRDQKDRTDFVQKCKMHHYCQGPRRHKNSHFTLIMTLKSRKGPNSVTSLSAGRPVILCGLLKLMSVRPLSWLLHFESQILEQIPQKVGENIYANLESQIFATKVGECIHLCNIYRS